MTEKKTPLPKGGWQNGISNAILSGGFAAGSCEFVEVLGENEIFHRESLRPVCTLPTFLWAREALVLCFKFRFMEQAKYEYL